MCAERHPRARRGVQLPGRPERGKHGARGDLDCGDDDAKQREGEVPRGDERGSEGAYTWAGQTFGGFFESDGRPTGQEDIQTVQCDTTAQTCTVDVPRRCF
jgi:hypothetical protein